MQQLTRRSLLAGLSGGLLGGPNLLHALAAQNPDKKKPAGETGRERPDFAAVDAVMEEVMAELRIAGGTLAVAHDGKIVVERGFGLADVEKRAPVRPETHFSIASVTKPFTGIGVLKLVDERKLRLDARLVDVLKAIRPERPITDPRFREITVHHLLYHASGIPGAVSASKGKAKGEHETDEVDALDQYRSAMHHELEFDPGTKSKYSNAGFVILRLVIEHVTGEQYEKFVREQVLRPMGVTRMHLEHGEHYEANEAHRYLPGGHKPAPRLVANWLATPADLVTFIMSVAGSRGKSFLSEQTTEKMLEVPPGIHASRNGTHVGLGWDVVRTLPDGIRFAKNGGKPGIHAWLEHLEYGVDWAVIFNTDPPEGKNVIDETRKRMYAAFQKILKIDADHPEGS